MSLIFRAEKFVESRKVNNEYSRLKDTRYLDHCGSALYAESQITAVFEDLKNNFLGNPHSTNLSSTYCRDAVDQVRFRILQHFNTDAEEYDVIFTAGATQSLKLVAEWFNWDDSVAGHTRTGHFVYSRDNHTSVLGLREIVAQRTGIHIHCLEHEDAFAEFGKPLKNRFASPHVGNALFVYSAQCNFSGCKYPLEWIKKVYQGALDEFVNRRICADEKSHYRWFSLLDAASYVSTNELNLQIFKPDFVVMSFYKIFGYPTGIGALLVKKTSAYILNKQYYGGGTITIALSNERFHRQKETLHERCEDGTINYLSILSLRHGFGSLRILGGTMNQISNKVFHLAQYLHGRLLKLHHSNGSPVAVIYHDTDYTNVKTQGGVVNFNLLRSTGKYIGYAEVLNAANLFEIYLRTGCCCNPGACQRHLKLTNDQLLENFKKGHICNDHVDLIHGYPTGSVRVSFGCTSEREDVDKLIEMIVECFVSQPVVIKIPADWAKTAQSLKNKFKFFDHFGNGFTKIESQIAKHRLEMLEIFDGGYNDGKMEDSGNLKLSEMFIYPVKSCSAFAVTSEWPIIETGLKYDREWMVVSAEGVVLTQKRIPKMCLIIPSIDRKNEVLSLKYKTEDKYEVNTNIQIPLNTHEENTSNSFPAYYSKVCSDHVMVEDCGDEIASWLQVNLQEPGIRLVRLKDRKTKKDEPLSLTNQAQYLLITESSAKWIQEKTNYMYSLQDIMRQFRGNFIISGNIKPLEELHWEKVAIGNCRFKVDEPCRRCNIICIDQSSGEKKKEILTTLAAELNGKIVFGVYMSLITADSASITIGLPVIPRISQNE